jgi:hypothetical protein
MKVIYVLLDIGPWHANGYFISSARYVFKTIPIASKMDSESHKTQTLSILSKFPSPNIWTALSCSFFFVFNIF